MTARILIVEDDPTIRMALEDAFKAEGYDVTVAPDGLHAEKLLFSRHFSLVLLDLMMPGKGGLEVLKQTREAGIMTPVILLTARSDENDKVLGLELGADDYLEKPFNPRELLARMNALLRRCQTGTSTAMVTGQITFSGWVLNCAHRKLHGPDDILVPLSSTEYGLMTAMISAAPSPVSREELARQVLGVDLGPEDRRVDILISRLRKKLSNVDQSANFIQTIRNQGYLFCADFNI